MIQWVLFILLTTSFPNTAATTIAGFGSHQACLEARHKILQNLNSYYTQHDPILLCVEVTK